MDIDKLETVLTAGHPTAGAYDADAEIAADQINAKNLDAPADPLALLNYCVMNDFRGEPIYGRIALVADSAVGALLPLDDAEVGITMTIKHIAAAKTFLRFMEPDVQASDALTSAGWDNILNALAGGALNAQCMGPTNKTDIQNLSKDKQSHAQKEGLGVVEPGHILEARR